MNMTSSQVSPAWVRPLRVAALVIGSLSLVGAGAVWVTPESADSLTSLSISLLGLGFTLYGVALALTIYERQLDESRAGEDRLKDFVKGQVTKAVRAAQSTTLDPAESEAASRDLPPQELEEDEEATRTSQVVDIAGQPGRFIEARDVPLSVIGNLVWGWRNMEEMQANEGRWSIGNLLGAWRPTSESGSPKGNFPWYLTFENSAGEIRVWRVYRGGKGKTQPTVRDVSSN